MYGLEMYIAEKVGLLTRTEDGNELTDKAMYPYHYIEQVYTNGYIDKMWHIARVQAIPDEIILR